LFVTKAAAPPHLFVSRRIIRIIPIVESDLRPTRGDPHSVAEVPYAKDRSIIGDRPVR
jgi:hypothetical protein